MTIICIIYKGPFLTGAHSALQLFSSFFLPFCFFVFFSSNKIHKHHQCIKSSRYNLLIAHPHTHQSVSCWNKVSFKYQFNKC